MNKIADKLHKVTATSLAGLTVASGLIFGAQIIDLFTHSRPRRQKLKDTQAPEIKDHFPKSNMATSSKILKFLRPAGFHTFSSCFCSTTEKKAWNIIKVNHLAVATKDLDKSVKFYRDVLGAKTSEPIPLPEHGVTTVFVELLNTKIELLLPFGSQSPIESFLEKNSSGGMHHICLEVDNIENAVEDLKAKDIRLLSDKPKIGAHGKPVIFLHPKDCGGVLIELEEL